VCLQAFIQPDSSAPLPLVYLPLGVHCEKKLKNTLETAWWNAYLGAAMYPILKNSFPERKPVARSQMNSSPSLQGLSAEPSVVSFVKIILTTHQLHPIPLFYSHELAVNLQKKKPIGVGSSAAGMLCIRFSSYHWWIINSIQSIPWNHTCCCEVVPCKAITDSRSWARNAAFYACITTFGNHFNFLLNPPYSDSGAMFGSNVTASNVGNWIHGPWEFAWSSAKGGCGWSL